MRIFSSFLTAVFLAACSGFIEPIETTRPIAPPSPTPAILSPTPIFIPTTTPTRTSEGTSTPIALTLTTETETPASISTPTATPFQSLVLEILNCSTSIDLSHQMGEVTNAFPRLRNIGTMDASNVCATLSASDEDREHPDKTHCVPFLPAGFQVSLKLTVDTGFQQDTSISVKVTTQEGLTVEATKPSCREIYIPGWKPDNLDVVQPIP